MSFWGLALLLIGSFSLGALPLTAWAVKQLTGKNLSQLGTGNISVAAAFTQAGKTAGIVSVCLEIIRGILPVIAAQKLFPNDPTWQLVSLIFLVAGRYWATGGGGVTNVTWGVLVYSPKVALSAGITGLLFWRLGVLFLPISKTSTRLWGLRCGCISGAFWIWFWHRVPNQMMPVSISEVVAAIILVIELVMINLQQADDVGLYMKQRLFYLSENLDPKICGEKATRLSQLKKAGFKVASGWILPAIKCLEDINILPKIKFNLGDFPLIVRSSAIGEDSQSYSAAGQYKSIGPVYSPAELEEAILQCRQSYWTEEAISYRQTQPMQDEGIAVLIQPYIVGEVAGVMFTRNPLDGGSQVIIEALAGGAEAVVGGQKTPVHLEIDITSSTTQCESIKQSQHQSILPKTILLELVQIAKSLEEFYHGIPQDIEWCWDGGRIWILQSRPITNLRPIWTRTIAAEVIPGVIPPLTWSINRPLTCGVWGEIFTIVLGNKVANLDFNETATLLASHAYFNASLLGEIFRMMGLPEQGLEFLVRGQKMGKPPLNKVLPSLPGLWRLVQRERGLDQEFKKDLKQIYLPNLQQLEADLEPDTFIPNTLPLPQLLERVERIRTILKTVTYYNILGPIGLAIRRALFKVPDSWIPTESAPEVASMYDLQRIADQLKLKLLDESEQTVNDNPEINQEFENWLNQYGYLSEVGTDISVPNWSEQPELFRQMLVNIARNQNERMESLHVSTLNLWEKWRQSKCAERTVVKGKIAEVYGKFLAHLRWTFLAIEEKAIAAGILENSGDIFYLEFSEIKQWIQQGIHEQFREIIRQRRQTFQEDCDRTVPAVVYGNVLPQPRKVANENLEKVSILQGIPASFGCVEGSIKICRSLADYSEDGEKLILVVPYTDAGWSPLLLSAKAIISEVGGQLSHGAIIAREYGIPAVMNIQGAMANLKNGQRVRVDGYQGTVELLD